MGLALKFRGIKFEHFAEPMRRDPHFAAIARKLQVTAPAEIDRLYPQLRPARVTVTTARGSFTRQADEALGSRIVPLDDAGLGPSFSTSSGRCSVPRGRSTWHSSSGRWMNSARSRHW